MYKSNTLPHRLKSTAIFLIAILLLTLVQYSAPKAHADGIDSYTKILNHFDTDYLDSIKTSRAYSTYGISLSTTSKFGGNSLDVTGDSAYLRTNDSDDFFFGTDDFTVDLWVYPTSSQEAYYSIIGTRSGSNVHFLPFYHYSNAFHVYQGSSIVLTTSNTSSYFTANTWHHLALQRDGNTLTLYVDGTPRGTATTAVSLGSSGSPLYYGTLQDSVSQDFKGYIDEVRVSKGIARYSGDFSGNLPTEAYSSTAPTVTNVAPSTGSTAGGTSVTITGTNFVSVTDVTFDGTSCTNITTVNDTTVTCDAPAHVAGTVDVEVTAGGSTGAGTSLYTYIVSGSCGPVGSDEQCAEQQIDCAAEVDFSIQKTPSAITFDVLTAQSYDQWSWDELLNADSTLPAANRIEVSDQRSGNVDGCPVATPGFQVTAEITTSLTNGSTNIADDQFYIVTTNEATFNSCTIVNGEEVCYENATAGTGNLHDIDAPALYDDYNRDQTVTWDCFDLASRTGTNPTYTTAASATDTTTATECAPSGTSLNNTLNNPVVIMISNTSHNQVVETGVALSGLIPGNTDPGTYQGTITYTLSKI